MPGAAPTGPAPAPQPKPQLSEPRAPVVNKVAIGTAIPTSVLDSDCFDGVVELFADCSEVSKDSDNENVNLNCAVAFDLDKFVAECETNMHYLNVELFDAYGNVVSVNCLFDSGTQTSVLRANAIEGLQYERLGTVVLHGFDNHKSYGELISLHVELHNRNCAIPVRFVVCENVSHDCLLSLADYRRLLEQDVKHDNHVSDAIRDPIVTTGEGSSLGLTSVDIVNDKDRDGNVSCDNVVNIYDDDDNVEYDVNDFQDASPLTSPTELINPDTPEVEKLVDEQKMMKL